MKTTNPKVDAYFRKAKKWKAEMEKLRAIALSCDLTEELKWGKPCYVFEGSNIVLIIGFKDYCSLLLCKGSLLKDPAGILIKAGEETQAARQIRFTDLGKIVAMEAVLKAYLEEAIAAQKAGLEVAFKPLTDLVYPDELQKALKENPALKTAFQALTPGRRRAYNLHFTAAKQSPTRTSRIEKCVPLILAGKGLNDEYVTSRRGK